MNIMLVAPTLPIAVLTIFTILHNDVNADDIERLPPINNPRTHETSEYRGIKLENGLQVLLISEAASLKSAVAMTIRIGAINDVKERPGIANLLRYLLLMANGKYTKKHEFKKYVQEHGGKLDTDFTYYNDAEHKQYFSFEISSDFLPRALVRFARYFIDPLFQGVDEAALRKALGDSFRKHERLMSGNKMRVDRLLKSLSEEGHPYGNLTYGTVEMLNKYANLGKEPLDEILSNFYSKWYSANLMCMVVMGTDSLDTLEQMIKASFGSIRNKKQEKLVFSDEQHPWKSDQLGHIIYIVPVVDKIRAIQLTFPAPDVLHQYKISPERYVIQFFNHRGPGTLGFVLQMNGLCKPRSLHAEYRLYAGIGFFHILMDLTKKGSKKVDYILGLTFQYIHLLRNKGVRKWFYDEIGRLDDLAFEKQSQRPRLRMIQSLASAMHDYPIQDILTHKFIRDPFDRTPIDDFLNYLRPEKVNISVINKSFEDIVDNIEPWYRTKYKIEKLSPTLLKEWNSPSNLYPELRIPTPNPFIPDDLNANIPELNEDGPEHSEYPTIIYASSLSRIWYKSEQSTSILGITIDIFCPQTSLSSMNRVLMNIFVRMLNFSLEEYKYFAESAAISYGITPTLSGLEIRLFGTNKVSVLLKRVLSRILNFERKMKMEDFEREKQRELAMAQSILNPEEASLKALLYAMCLRNEIRSNGFKPNIFNTKEAKYEAMRKFPVKLFSRIYIQGLIQGRCNTEKAKQIANTIDELFRSTSHGVLPQEVLHPRVVHMDFGKQFVFHTYSNSSNHYYYAYFPFSSRLTRDYATGITLFSYIIFETCTKILPPKETGFSNCEIERADNFFGFVIKISSQMHPKHMDIRVERFLEIMHNLKVQFNRNNLENQMNDEIPDHEFYWEEIFYHSYDFKVHTREKHIIRGLHRKDVLNLFQEVLAKGAPKRRKLAVYVFSKKLIQSMPENLTTEDVNENGIQNTKIEDITKYKNSMRLCPVAVPDLIIRR